MLSQRITWLVDEPRDLSGNPARSGALVTVIGREHYEEVHQHYPIRSASDLRRVLFVGGADPQTMVSIGPLVGEKREVTLFKVRPEISLSELRTIFIVPETLILRQPDSGNTISLVERRGAQYFIAPNGVSQLAGALIQDPAAFAVAVGVADHAVHTIREDELSERLQHGLRAFSLGVWPVLLSDYAKRISLLAAKRVSVLLALVFTAYLILILTYYAVAGELRRRELVALGTEVDALLIKQRDVDRLGSEYGLIVEKLRERRFSIDAWRIAGTVWKSGGRITGFEFDDNALTVRGRAKNATELLRNVSSLPRVTGAKFDSPVRQDGDEQEFSIGMTLIPGGVDRE